MEPHAAAADDRRPTDGCWSTARHRCRTCCTSSLADALGMVRKTGHVVTPHVGGGFGGKAGIYPEQSVVAQGGLTLGAPGGVDRDAQRGHATLSHSRAQIQYVELGCKRDGTFTGLRVRLVGDAGAYPGIGAFLPAGTRRMSNGTYRFPAIQFDVAVAVTNTTPMGAYRGAGRPEATALLERVVDQAALELGIDPDRAAPHATCSADDVFPFKTLTGITYDSGATAPARRGRRCVGYEELRARAGARRATGDRQLLGIGVSAYVEITAGGGARSTRRCRSTRTARPASWPARRPTGRATRPRSR